MLAGIPPIGYAKPVPINPNNFKNPRVGSAITGVAGPTGNLILATFFSIIYRFSHATLPALATFAAIIVIINVTLMIFNLIPIPPLDGSRLLALVFPQLENPKFELYGFVLLFIFIYLFHGFSYLVPIVDAIVFRAFGVPFTM
jgi:Zn-dependent protease